MLLQGSESSSESRSSFTQDESLPETGYLQSDFDGEGFEAGDEEALVRIANQAIEQRIALSALRRERIIEDVQPGTSEKQKPWNDFVGSP